MSVRKTNKLEVDSTVTLLCMELEFCDATDLLSDMTAAIGMASGNALTIGMLIAVIGREFSGGRLSSLLTRLLAGTTLIAKGDDAVKVEFIDSKDKLNKAFTGRQKYIGPAIKQALEVSFAGFLDALRLAGIKIPTLSLSGDSIPDTNDIG